MSNTTYVTGRFEFDLPNNFSGVDGAILLPSEPEKWVDKMKASLDLDEGVSVVAQMIADGSESAILTFCPNEEKKDSEVDCCRTNFSIILSKEATLKLGKALIALAELNSI